MDVASLVIGIICLVIGFIPCLQVVVIVPAVAGLIMGIVAFTKKRGDEEPTGIALAGIILNAIPLLIIMALGMFIGIGSEAYTIPEMTIR